MAELLPDNNEGVPLVPQLLVNSAEAFNRAERELAAMGYTEINLNVGCPSKTVTAKGKGCGLLSRPDKLRELLDGIFAAPEVKISVKTRLGMKNAEEFGKILEIYNDYPICELTIHARVQEDYYKRPASFDAFERWYPRCAAPVCYNGDLLTASACGEFSARFPLVPALMLGRGLVGNPALAEECCGGEKLTRKRLRAFHDELFEAYRASLWSDNAVLCHMKDLWTCMGNGFAGCESSFKRLKKSASLADYISSAQEIFSYAELK
jgi:tRNA-dihydrouridine synthase